MKQATAKLYIRFGRIPTNGISKVHFGDEKVREEGGLSVWRATEVNGRYYPILPDDANDNSIADYFTYLITSNKPVYLVTGMEMRLEGADREVLLYPSTVSIVDEISYYYGNTREENYIKRRNDLKGVKEAIEDSHKPYIITMIGSKKFLKEFNEKAIEFARQGIIVFTPAIFEEDQELTPEQHAVYDALHRQKMLMSNEVYVVNPGDYVGKDTEKEINWARENHIKLTFMVAKYNDSMSIKEFMNKLTDRIDGSDLRELHGIYLTSSKAEKDNIMDYNEFEMTFKSMVRYFIQHISPTDISTGAYIYNLEKEVDKMISVTTKWYGCDEKFSKCISDWFCGLLDNV